MTKRRSEQLRKLQVAWSKKVVSIGAKILEVQQQKSELLSVAQGVAILMQGDEAMAFKFQDIVNKRLNLLSQDLVVVNINLENLRSQHFKIAEQEKRVEKLVEKLRAEYDIEQAAIQLAEVLDYVLMLNDISSRKLATSSM
jgi:hypothetical protein